MDYILYYKIREQLIKDYNYLNGGAVAPDITFDENDNTIKSLGNPPLIPKYTPGEMLTKLGNIETILNKLNDPSKLNELQRFIETYKDRLNAVITKADIYLKKANAEKGKFAPDVLVNFFKGPNKFTEKVDEYHEKISNESWTGERINKELYDDSKENPELMDELFFDNSNTLDNFNKELLLLFTPFLTSYDSLKDLSDDEKKTKLNENLQSDIKNLEDLIKLAEKYNLYINNKRQGVESILNTVYSDGDVKIHDNTDNKKNKEDFMEKLEEAQVPNDAKLNFAEIRNISSTLTSVIKGLEINDEMKLIQEFDIFDININLIDKLSLNGIVSFNTNSMRGGEFETKYIVTKKTNEKLFTLLSLTEKLYLTLDTILNDSKYLQQVQIRYNYYLAYIFLIIRQSASKDVLTVFKYLNKDIIEKYLNIFEKIKAKFINLTSADKNTIYLNKYHYLTINKLINLFNFLRGKITSPNILIDVSKCTGNVQNDLNLFNHFKSIIKGYLNTAEGQTVTGLTPTEVNGIWFDLD